MKKVLSLLISIIMVFGVFSIVPIDVSAVSIKCGISVEGGVTGNLDDAPLPKATSSFYSDESPCFSLVVDKDLYINYAELIIYKNGSEYTRATRTPNLTYFRFCNVQYDAFPAGSYTYEWNYHVAESASGPYHSYNSGKLSFKVSNQPTVTISKNKSFYANGETATFKVNASGGKNTLTYQWYKAVDIVGNKSTVISGATSSTLNITANSSSQGYYYYCIVSDGERKVISSLLYLDCDTSKPVVTLSSTNNVASTQTVTVKLSDNIGIKGYYWGTSSTYSNNSYTSTSNTSFSKSITSPGTYYVTAVDTYGNVSSTQSITFYKTTLNANGGSVSPTSILTMSGKSFVFPTPNRSGNYTYSGWSTSSSALNGVGSLTPSSNSTYYAVWKINYINVSNCTITLGTSSYTYDGNAKQPSVTVKYGSTTLTKDTDYSVSYSNNTNAGTATVTVTGKGSYTGTATKTFTISAKSVSSAAVTLSQTSYTYDGSAKKPTVTVKDGTKTLVNGTDYSVSYSNNINVGTATVTVTGKGNYTGTVTKNFTITEALKVNISNCTITLGTTFYTYSGSAKQPSVTVKYGSTTLTNGTDYTITYSNNTNVGTATVTVTGKGNYTGTVSKTFTISAKSVSSATVTLSQTSYTYDGSAKKPTVTVKDGTKTLVNGTEYSASYSNNINVGTATVTVTGKGNYTGTVTKNFTITKPATKEFEWGKDNWRFNNSAPTYFKRSSYRNQISSSYQNELKNNLTNSEYQVIFNGTWYSTAWIDDMWGGSCYGMSATALLAKNGLLPYSEYGNGATKLSDLGYPKNNSEVSSLITYYQMLQVKDVIQQQYRSVPYESHERNIKNIISQLDNNSMVLLGFKKDGWGGHAIIAYDYEYGSWTYNGVTYDGCIKICDPNASTAYNSQSNIYFNSKTYSWTIPLYSYVPITSSSGAKFNYIGANVSDINQGGYLVSSSNKISDDFIARIDAYAIDVVRTVSKVINVNGAYMNQSTGPGEIVEDYSYILGGESKGTLGYNLFDSKASYRITQENPVQMQLRMDYENCDLSGNTAAGVEMIFDDDGYIKICSEASEYTLSMTHDIDYPTTWFSMTVSGDNAEEVSLKMVESGYVLTANNLDNVVVKANNKDVQATINFSTGYDSVLIYEIDENTIGVKADTDNNGTYETDLIDADITAKLGDANGDGKVNVKDATEIQKAVAGLLSLDETEEVAADVDGSGTVNVKDATAIQKWVAGIETGFLIGEPVKKQ